MSEHNDESDDDLTGVVQPSSGHWSAGYEPVRQRTDASMALADMIERLGALDPDDRKRVLRAANAFFGGDHVNWAENP